MSEIQKCPNLIRGGGQHFSKMSEIQKCPNCRRGGGGVNPNWDIVPNFLVFFSDASPKIALVYSALQPLQSWRRVPGGEVGGGVNSHNRIKPNCSYGCPDLYLG